MMVLNIDHVTPTLKMLQWLLLPLWPHHLLHPHFCSNHTDLLLLKYARHDPASGALHIAVTSS